MAGSIFWSIMADRCGRRPAFVLSLLVTFIAGIGSALAPTFLSFVVLRVIVGFGVGGNLPVAVSLAVEFLPTPTRATGLMIVTGVFWGLGQLFASAIGLLLGSVIGYRCVCGSESRVSHVKLIATQNPRLMQVRMYPGRRRNPTLLPRTSWYLIRLYECTACDGMTRTLW